MGTQIKTREEAEKVCTGWACDEPEQVTCTSPEEAIEEYLDSHDVLTGTIQLTGYRPMPIHYDPISGPLSQILESLDEDYVDPDGDGTTPTAAMQVAEKIFIAAVLSEYKNHWLENVYIETIDVGAWVMANHPEWLEEERGCESP